MDKSQIDFTFYKKFIEYLYNNKNKYGKTRFYKRKYQFWR